MSRLDPWRNYCIACTRGTSTTECHISVQARDRDEAYEKIRDLGYVPCFIMAIN